MQTIGRYRITGELARGGQGVVLRAEDDQLGRPVAIKVLTLARSPTARKRFLREVSALARLRHPNVVPIHDVGEHAGQPFLVMELVDGESLHTRLERQGPLAPREAAALVRDLADAVAYAHAQGILHRDLKPSNVLLLEGGRRKGPLLVDFGLAKELTPDASRLSVTGSFLGTLGFWAPEQARGELDAIGPRTDVFGLGALLFACLTREAPLPTDDVGAAFAATERRPPAPSTIRRDGAIDSALDAICLQCLEPDPAARPASAEELAEQLEAYLEQAPAGGGGSRVVLALVVAVATLVVAFALAVVVSTTRSGPSTAASATPALPAADAPVPNPDPTSVPNPDPTPAPPTGLAAREDLLVSGLAALRREPVARLTDCWGEARQTLTAMGTSVAVSPDGDLVAAGDLGGLVVVTRVRDGASVWATLLPPGRVWSLCFAGSKRLIVGDQRGVVRAFDLARDPASWRVQAHAKSVTDVCALPNGRLISAAEDGLRLWDAATGAPLGQVEVPGQGRVRIAFAPNRPQRALLTRGGAVALWDLTTLTPLRALGRLDRSVRDLLVSPDGQLGITLDEGGSVTTWNLETGRRLGGWGKPDEFVRGLALTPRGEVVTGSLAGDLQVHDRTSGARLRTHRVGHTNWIERLATSPDGRLLASVGNDQQVRLFDVKAGRPHWNFPQGHRASVTALLALPDGSACSASFDGTIHRWRRGERVGTRIVVANRGWVRDLALLGDGRVLFAGHMIGIWRVGDPKPQSMGWSRRSIHSLVSRGSEAFSVDTDGVLGSWSVTSGGLRSRGKLEMGRGFSTLRAVGSPSGSRLAFLGTEPRVHVYTTDAQGVRAGFIVDVGMSIRALAFAGEKRLLLGADNGTVWEVGGGTDARIGRHTGMVSSIAVAPTGARAVTAGADGVRVWDLPNQRELAFVPLRHTLLDLPQTVSFVDDKAFLVGTRRGLVLRFELSR